MTKYFGIKDMVSKNYVEVSPGIWSKATPKDAVKIPKKKAHKYGAKAVDVDGQHFDSTREYNFSLLLKQHGIKFRMKEKFELQPGFEYLGEKIRPICIIPDYIILAEEGHHVAIVDIKGMIMPDFRIKIKMLKFIVAQSWGRKVPIFMPTNKKEMNETIDKLLTIINKP